MQEKEEKCLYSSHLESVIQIDAFCGDLAIGVESLVPFSFCECKTLEKSSIVMCKETKKKELRVLNRVRVQLLICSFNADAYYLSAASDVHLYSYMVWCSRRFFMTRERR